MPDHGEESMDSNKRCHAKCIVCGGNDPQRKYHSIPTKPVMRNKWLEACGLQASAIEKMKRPTVCSLHFERNDYIQNDSKRRTILQKTAVPSLRLNELELNVDINASPANADDHVSAANADNHASATNTDDHAPAANTDAHASARNADDHASATNADDHASATNADDHASAAIVNDQGEEIMGSRKRRHAKCIACGGSDPEQKYHSIPSKPLMRNKWLEACGLQASAIENMKRPTVCSLHFERNDYTQNNSRGRTKLRKTAVPSLRLNELELNTDMNTSAANANDHGEESMDSNKRCHAKCIICGGKDPQLKYHSIPTKPVMRKKWLEACGLQASAIESMKRPMVCSLHFELNDYTQNNSKGRTKLRKIAVPSLSLNESELLSADKNASAANADDNETPPFAETATIYKTKSKRVCVLCPREKRTEVDIQYSYHSFPEKNDTLFQKWLTACCLTEIEYKSHMLVCSKHFEEADFYPGPKGVRCTKAKLKGNVFPTRFLGWACVNSIEDEDEAMEEDNYCEETISDKPHNEDLLMDDNPPNDTQECMDGDVLESFAHSLSSDTPSSPLPTDENLTLTPTRNAYNQSSSPAVRATTDGECVTHTPVSSPLATVEVGGIMSTPTSSRKRRHPENANTTSVSNTSTPKRKCGGQFNARGTLLWRYAADIGSPHCQTPRRALRSVDFLKSTIRRQTKMIESLKKKVNRQSRRIMSFKCILGDLQHQKLISHETTQHILDSLPPSMRSIALRKWVGKTAKFDNEVRKFALTLHFYSPKAYNYVRKSWMKLLPHPGTLRKWCCTVNCAPGFSDEVLNYLKKRKETPICNLVVDEMSIRQQLVLKNGKPYGLVDLGLGENKLPRNTTEDSASEEDESERTDEATLPALAKQALVFMLVSLKEKWKVPMAYFLIDSLNGEERANLVRKALELLHDSGVVIPSLTFDGTSTNFDMAEKLGGSFKFGKKSLPFQPYIYHPVTKEKIFIFPDASHMIKNVRNVLGRTVQRSSTGNWKVTMIDEDEGIISFRHIMNLVNLQNDIGLKIANKVTDRHIKFWENRMNVRLAVQTLSHSVSSMLQYLKDSGDNTFRDSESTAKFCNEFNDAFDMANVRSAKQHGQYGIRLSDDNREQLKERANDIIDYIKGLKGENGDPLIQGRQRSGFIGFISILTNLFELFEFLKEKYNFTHLYSYKLSQDHLENFFSCIRMKGGFNNNPNAHQFNVAYRRLIIHHELSSSGNCIDDEVPILAVTGATFVPSREDFVELESHSERFNFEGVFIPSQLVKDVVQYIGGFVIKKLLKHPVIGHCCACQEAIEDSTRHCPIIDAKTKGYLKKPSLDLESLLLRIEGIIRENEGRVFDGKFVQATICKMEEELETKFFGPHIGPEDEKMICHMATLTYLRIRLHYESVLVSKVEKYIRRRMTKLITFLNQ